MVVFFIEPLKQLIKKQYQFFFLGRRKRLSLCIHSFNAATVHNLKGDEKEEKEIEGGEEEEEEGEEEEEEEEKKKERKKKKKKRRKK